MRGSCRSNHKHKTDEVYKTYNAKVSKIKDSSEVDGRKILLIYEVESLVFKTLDAASFHLKDLECLINDSTDGLRVITPEKQEARQIVEGLSTKQSGAKPKNNVQCEPRGTPNCSVFLQVG